MTEAPDKRPQTLTIAETHRPSRENERPSQLPSIAHATTHHELPPPRPHSP